MSARTVLVHLNLTIEADTDTEAEAIVEQWLRACGVPMEYAALVEVIS